MELPEELLADILRRVPPKRLAACRCVCREWRAAIDDHTLVVSHLLPGGPHGVFINYTSHDCWSDTCFFSRGMPADDGIDTRLASVSSSCTIIDHCNGILLCVSDDDTCFVYNPATRRSAQVPAPEGMGSGWNVGSPVYLMFDPVVSLHFEVFFLPDRLPVKPKEPIHTKPSPPPPFNVGRLFMASGEDNEFLPEVYTDDEEDWLVDSEEEDAHPHYLSSLHEHVEVRDTMEAIEWPPVVYMVHVFSSKTRWWKERAFVRKDGAIGSVAGLWQDLWLPRVTTNIWPRRRYTVYWRNYLYIECRGDLIMRFSLATRKYLAIKCPEIVKDDESSPRSQLKATSHLSKSRKGIYYTTIDKESWLQIWILNDESEASRGTPPVWEMVHYVDMEPPMRQLLHENRKHMSHSWILDHEEAKPINLRYHEWDSDDDHDVTRVVREDDGDEDHSKDYWFCSLDHLGYHPDKEIVFLASLCDDGAYAYFLGTNVLQYLGDHSRMHGEQSWSNVREAYVYTPCRFDLLPDENGTLY